MNNPIIMYFHNGMTLAELKEYIKNMPDVDENDEPYKVWIGNGNGLSNEVRRSSYLNWDGVGSDLLLESKYYGT